MKELQAVSPPRRRIPYLKFINGVLKLCQLKGNKMPSISILKLSIPPPKLSYSPRFLIPTNPSTLINFPHCPHLFLTSRKPLLCSKEEEAEVSKGEDEWLQKLPDKNKPLYSHSLPCLEAWLKKLGFCQSKEDRAVWFVEKPDWHAQLSLDVTDLYIRYVKNGPGNLEKDVERRFSYALSRDDIENAILGGP